MPKPKVKKLEAIGTMIGTWAIVVAFFYPVAWFVSGVTVSGRCAVPPPDMVVKCANQYIRAGRIEQYIMNLAGVVGLVVAISATRENIKSQLR